MKAQARTSRVAASLPIVWSDVSSLGSGERGGRTPLQRRENQYSTTTTFMSRVCASHSRFQPITQDREVWRKRSEFALSGRQHEFESRWGYKIKPPLTRPNPLTPCTGGGTAVRARQATESAVMLDTAGQPSRLGWTPKPTSARGDVAHIERRRLRQRDASGRTRMVVHYKVRYRDAKASQRDQDQVGRC